MVPMGMSGNFILRLLLSFVLVVDEIFLLSNVTDLLIGWVILYSGEYEDIV